MAAARWEELLPKWNRAAWGCTNSFPWEMVLIRKFCNEPRPEHSLSIVAIDTFFKCFPRLLSLLVWIYKFCFWLHPAHRAVITPSFISCLQRGGELLCIPWNSSIFSGLSRLRRGWLKKCMEVSRWWGFFFIYFCFVFDESYASIWGRKSIVMWLIEERFCKQQFIA